MTAVVTWFTETAHTYQLERYIPGTMTWTIVHSEITPSEVPWTDVAGVPADYYRVCDDTAHPILSPYSPQFHGQSTAPATTVVYGTIIKSDGTPLQDSVVEFRIVEDQSIGGCHFSVPDYLTTQTDILGYWEQELVQTLHVYVRIPDLDLYEEITVPTTGPVALDSLL